MLYEYIDLDEALNQLGGSEKLYKTVVTGFYDKYKHVDDMIMNLFESGEREEAGRLAHSIKGLSGNLGAPNLRLRALDLELAIKNNQTDIDLEYQAFKVELAHVIEEVKDILVNRYGAIAEPTPTVVHGEEQFYDKVNLLIHALSTYRYSEVKEALTQLEITKTPQKHLQDMKKVVRYIEEYEYDLANTILRRMN